MIDIRKVKWGIYRMKRILILIVALFAIVAIGDLVNGIGANDKPTLEGYLLNREGSLSDSG